MGCWGITAFQLDTGLDSVDYIRRSLPENGELDLGKIPHCSVNGVDGRFYKKHISDFSLDHSSRCKHPLFTNRSGDKLTRAGIKYILDKYTYIDELMSVFLDGNLCNDVHEEECYTGLMSIARCCHYAPQFMSIHDRCWHFTKGNKRLKGIFPKSSPWAMDSKSIIIKIKLFHKCFSNLRVYIRGILFISANKEVKSRVKNSCLTHLFFILRVYNELISKRTYISGIRQKNLLIRICHRIALIPLL